MTVLNCWVDGGCEPNPGKMYGSFLVETDPNHTIIHRFKFVDGTNNLAEYLALLELLDWLDEQIHYRRLAEIVIHMDSQLVMNQISGNNAVNAEHLKRHCSHAQAYICHFDIDHGVVVTFKYYPEDQMKRKLGH